MDKNRRDFLKISGMAGLSLAGSSFNPALGRVTKNSSSLTPAQDNNSAVTALNRLPRMIQEYFVGRIRQLEKEADARRSLIRSKQDAENYVREVQEKIRNCFVPWPEKTPLNARVTGILKRDGYNVEKIIFESRPGFPVTANLYVPRGRRKQFPGVIGTCGHSDNGKASEPYQSFAQGLAKLGYIVLIFDPIGQGERLQYVTEDLKPVHGIGVLEHLYAGNQMVLTGESLSSWFAWDGIRALDYLLTRPEVDKRYLGVTGNSGGGTQTTWLCGVEPRFTMAAPSCFVTTFRRNLENELPADSEQYPFGVLAAGLDHSDFIAAMAPKPVILLGQAKDYFDARGLEESFSRLRHLYRLLGAEQNIGLYIGPDYHGYSQLNREAMYRWFNSVTKISDQTSEPPISIEKDEQLWCTQKGQTGEFKPATIFSFTGRLSSEPGRKRASPSGDALKEVLTGALKLPPFDDVPEFRILRPAPNRRYPKRFAANYLVETEPGIGIILYRLDDNPLLSRPPAGFKKAILYVSNISADKELREEEFLKDLINSDSGSAFFACDVRGTGESQPDTCNYDFFAPYGSDYFYAGHSLMLDYPYVGQKTYDILKIINLIRRYGHDEIHLAGMGWGAVPATFAAVLSDNVSRVTLKNALVSYRDIIENEEYNWPLSSFVPGVLGRFDLPDCYRALLSKGLKQIEPWNGKSKKIQ
jgi:cephalosporin-C deacetylase-like acetyl esterase